MKYEVYFSKSTVPLFQKIFKKGFQHVQIGCENGVDDMIFFNVNINGISCSVLPRHEVRKQTKGLRKLRVRKNAPSWSLFPCLGSCVTIVKKFLGIRAPWVITPYQLYKYLKKHGGEEF